MARCALDSCRRWRPDLLVRRGTGLHVDDDWFCSRSCLQSRLQERLTRAARTAGAIVPGHSRIRIGVLLLTGEARLDPALLAKALEAQRHSGRRLGEELRRMGAVSNSALQRALARQASTNYLATVDPAAARPGYAGLSREMVTALGLVPFAADDEHRVLKVVYVAPLSRVAISALRELTGWTPDPYLVSDEVWPTLLETYGTAREDAAATTEAVGSLNQALERIADAAERTPRARIAEARLDSSVWIRVQSDAVIEDLLMPAALGHEDTRWQTAPTLH